MTLSPLQQNDLRDLIDAACENDPEPTVLERLESLLLADDDACRYYLDYVSLHGALILASEKKPTEEGLELIPQGSEIRKSQIPNQQIPNQQIPNQQIPNLLSPILSTPSPVILDTSDSLSPLAPAPSPFYVSHPFVFSNLFAMLIICLGALGAWFYQVDIPQPMASVDRPATSLNRTTNPAAKDPLEFVGRVTGMVDVQWADVQTSTVIDANVPLGRKYALASGLMEIRYDSGAKVILQGPVTYEVDSRKGGYLSVGKLTAKLEKRGEGREESQEKPSAVSSQQSEKVASGQWPVASEERSEVRGQGAGITNPKSQISNPQSLIPNPSFAVRTPTAVVTDLGTEFGVEVSKEGVSHVTVFTGEVIASTKDIIDTVKPVHLKAGQSAGIDKTKITLIQRPTLEAPTFVRKLGKPISSNLAHLWTFDDDLKDAVGSAHGTAINKPTLQPGILGSNALQLRDRAYVELPYFRPDLHFTVTGWIKTTTTGEEALEILGWGGLYRSAQFRISGDRLQYGDFADNWLGVTGKSPMANGQWRHVAMVRDYEHVRLYVDGALEGEGATHAMQLQDKLSIGANLADLGSGFVGLYYFQGSIDDLGYWRIALPEIRISAIYQLGIHPMLRYGQRQASSLFSLFLQRQGEVNIDGKVWRYRDDLPEGKPGSIVTNADRTILLYLENNSGVSTTVDFPVNKQ